MKIAIDARNLRSTSGRYHRQLLNWLQQLDREHEYHVIMLKEDQEFWQPSAANFKAHVVPYENFTFGEQLGFKRWLKRLKPDLVHFLFPQQPVLHRGLRVTTVHDLTHVHFASPKGNKWVYAIKNRIYTWLIKNVSRRSTFVITPTNHVKNELVRWAKLKPDKVVVTYEAAEPMAPTASQPIPELQGKPFLLYVGTAFPYKNLARLTDAYAQLKQAMPTLQLAFAGKKTYFHEQLEAYVKKQNYPDVHFLDFVSEGQLVWLYQHARAYVFPSLSEGFGLPALEAMLFDLPVASSNATCLPEVYGAGAAYFNPLDVNDMAQTIEELLADEEERKRLVQEARKQLAKYSWEKMAKETLAIYQQAKR